MEDGSQDPSQEPGYGVHEERSSSAQLWYAIRLCLGFLTRIPVFSVEYSGRASLAASSWAFPVVGIVVALAGAVVLWLADKVNLGGQLSALLALAAITLLTGALHEDGLADTADGFGLAGDIEKRIAAMRDPRIGVFGMVAIVIVFGARWIALGDLISISLSDGVTGLIAAAAISRGVLPAVMHSVPNARTEGLSFGAGRPEARPVGIALAISAVVAFFAFGFGGAILVLIVAGLTTYIVTIIARRLIGGQTGDVLGAIQQLTESAVLIAASGLAS